MSYLGESIKKLGFGLMRLPMMGEDVDIEQTKKMVDYFMENGFTYFDTAYVYIGGKSECVLKEAVVDRYPRESFQTASKLPVFNINKPEEMMPIFEESCTRAGLDYYDFYLLHSLSSGSYPKTNELGAWDFLKQLKADGRIKHLGFSFHDKAELLEQILTEHPEAEFVQLQINYADWEDGNVQSRKCYEVARAHNVPVIVMEPVKGGSLATMVPEIQDMFKECRPDMSVASWALRYTASMDGIITVLSGMSDWAQMEDNCKTFKNFEPLSDEENKVLDKAVEKLKNIHTVPCTSCKYCVDDCPQNINIPFILDKLNNVTLYNNLEHDRSTYAFHTKEKGKASDCIACGLCEGICPQHIDIIDQLKSAVSVLE